MKSATGKQKDLNSNLESAGREFYKAGMAYLSALDLWIENRAQRSANGETASARRRVQLLESALHNLFPDEFADTAAGAE